MGLTKYNGDTDNISKLPNRVFGNPDNLKARFDKAGADLAGYINKTLTEEIDDELDNKVDKVAGKGLSEADFTNDEKEKLVGIEEGAEVNVQADWEKNDSSADDFIKNKPTKLSEFINDGSGSGEDEDHFMTEAEFLASYDKFWDERIGVVEGDLLIVQDDLNNKVDKESGKGLSEADFTNDEKEKLVGIEEGAEVNVQADWNQTVETADDFIKNKPTKLSDFVNDNNTVTDGHYIHTDNNYTSSEKTKLEGIEAGAEVNVQADWEQDDSSADDFIKNKPDLSLKANISEVYNKAEIDDKLAGKQNELTFDDEPAYTSTNPVTSEGIWFKFADVYDALDVKEDVPTINEDYSSGVAHVALNFRENNKKIYLITSDTVSDVTVYIANGEYPKDFIFQVSMIPQLSAPQIVYDASKIINWVGTDCSVSGTYSIFAPAANKHYDIIFYFNGSQFIGLVNGYVPAGGNS